MNCLQEPNMRYKLIVFDFDGTIADTSLGIIDSHKYVLEKMGHVIPSDNDIIDMIGKSLLEAYINVLGFSEHNARLAIQLYRNRYDEVGIGEAFLYDGMLDLLKLLHEQNYKIGIATLKADKFVKCMIKKFKIDSYVDYVFGMDDKDKLVKADLVFKCIDACGCTKEEVLLIGDSKNDWEGARSAKVDFLGVSYGFGFKPNEKYEFDVVNSLSELEQFILNY